MMNRNGWASCDFERYFKLLDRMAIEVVRGSPLLNMTDRTSIGSALSKIAYGVIQSEYEGAHLEEPPPASKPSLKIER